MPSFLASCPPFRSSPPPWGGLIRKEDRKEGRETCELLPLMPSPLGKVPERSEGQRGRPSLLCYPTTINAPSSHAVPCGLAGKGMGALVHVDRQRGDGRPLLSLAALVTPSPWRRAYKERGAKGRKGNLRRSFLSCRPLWGRSLSAAKGGGLIRKEDRKEGRETCGAPYRACRPSSAHAVPPGLLEKLRQQPPHAPAGVKSLSEAKGKGVDHCHTHSPHRPALHGRCADPRQSVRAGWDGSVDPCWPAWRRCSTPFVTRCARDTFPREEGL